MKLILKNWQFEGEPRERVSPELVSVLESIFPSTDSRSLPLMAAVRKGDGLKLGQVPDLLDKFKIPFDLS